MYSEVMKDQTEGKRRKFASPASTHTHLVLGERAWPWFPEELEDLSSLCTLLCQSHERDTEKDALCIPSDSSESRAHADFFFTTQLHKRP